jgi:hypothetical protein
MWFHVQKSVAGHGTNKEPVAPIHLDIYSANDRRWPDGYLPDNNSTKLGFTSPVPDMQSGSLAAGSYIVNFPSDAPGLGVTLEQLPYTSRVAETVRTRNYFYVQYKSSKALLEAQNDVIYANDFQPPALPGRTTTLVQKRPESFIDPPPLVQLHGQIVTNRPAFHFAHGSEALAYLSPPLYH